MARIPLKKMIDDLGRLRAEIAALEVTEKTLVEKIKTLGAGRRSGKLFEANAYWQTRFNIDWPAIMEEAKVPRKLIKKYTDENHVLCLTLTARKAPRRESKRPD